MKIFNNVDGFLHIFSFLFLVNLFFTSISAWKKKKFFMPPPPKKKKQLFLQGKTELVFQNKREGKTETKKKNSRKISYEINYLKFMLENYLMKDVNSVLLQDEASDGKLMLGDHVDVMTADQ